MSDFTDLDVRVDTSFDDGLSADEDLNPYDLLDKYLNSRVSIQRVLHVKHLAECVREWSFEVMRSFLIARLPKLLEDDAEVKAALAHQFGDLAQMFLSNGRYVDVVNVFLARALELLLEESAQVREAAADSITRMAPMLTRDHVEIPLMRSVLSLARDSLEERRVVAAKMMNDLAPVFGCDLCESFIVSELMSLCRDPICRVRKAAVGSMDKLIPTVNKEYIKSTLLPLYLDLCKDEAWSVRKACAESVVAVSQAVDMSTRTNELAGSLDVFAQDVSRWVRNTALQQLGPFLATLQGSEVPPALLKHFLGMATPANSEFDLCRTCAFNFPALVLVLGPDRWSELSETYNALARDPLWKVRRTLAFSIHEVARILGRAVTESVLLPVLDAFRADIDEVKEGVVRHLSSFLEMLRPTLREDYLPMLTELQTDIENWRFRKLLANQVASLATLFPEGVALRTIVPMAMSLCRDPVAVVRRKAHAAVATLLCSPVFSSGPIYAFIIQELKAFSTNPSFNNRQTFISVCEELLRCSQYDASAFERDLLPALLSLHMDRVANVRMALARLLSSQLVTTGHFFQHPSLAEVLTILSRDRDRDVSFFASLHLPSTNNSTNPLTSPGSFSSSSSVTCNELPHEATCFAPFSSFPDRVISLSCKAPYQEDCVSLPTSATLPLPSHRIIGIPPHDDKSLCHTPVSLIGPSKEIDHNTSPAPASREHSSNDRLIAPPQEVSHSSTNLPRRNTFVGGSGPATVLISYGSSTMQPPPPPPHTTSFPAGGSMLTTLHHSKSQHTSSSIEHHRKDLPISASSIPSSKSSSSAAVAVSPSSSSSSEATYDSSLFVSQVRAASDGIESMPEVFAWGEDQLLEPSPSFSRNRSRDPVVPPTTTNNNNNDRSSTRSVLLCTKAPLSPGQTMRCKCGATSHRSPCRENDDRSLLWKVSVNDDSPTSLDIDFSSSTPCPSISSAIIESTTIESRPFSLPQTQKETNNAMPDQILMPKTDISFEAFSVDTTTKKSCLNIDKRSPFDVGVSDMMFLPSTTNSMTSLSDTHKLSSAVFTYDIPSHLTNDDVVSPFTKTSPPLSPPPLLSTSPGTSESLSPNNNKTASPSSESSCDSPPRTYNNNSSNNNSPPPLHQSCPPTLKCDPPRTTVVSPQPTRTDTPPHSSNNKHPRNASPPPPPPPIPPSKTDPSHLNHHLPTPTYPSSCFPPLLQTPPKKTTTAISSAPPIPTVPPPSPPSPLSWIHSSPEKLSFFRPSLSSPTLATTSLISPPFARPSSSPSLFACQSPTSFSSAFREPFDLKKAFFVSDGKPAGHHTTTAAAVVAATERCSAYDRFDDDDQDRDCYDQRYRDVFSPCGELGDDSDYCSEYVDD